MKNIFKNVLLVLGILSASTCDSHKEATPITSSSPSFDQEYWLFVGNPGAGKSSIVNALAGKEVSKAEVSQTGAGVTTAFISYNDVANKRIYLDTPGLEETDLNKKNNAAKQIEMALKQNGKYKIFFIINLDAGRVSPADVATFNTVMDAINLSHKPFSIILNKIEKDEKSLLENDKARALIFTNLNSGNNKTQSIWFIEKNEKVRKKKIPSLILGDKLWAFFNTRESIKISEEQIREVNTNSLEGRKKALEATLEQIKTEFENDKAKQKVIIDKMTIKFNTLKTQIEKFTNQ